MGITQTVNLVPLNARDYTVKSLGFLGLSDPVIGMIEMPM